MIVLKEVAKVYQDLTTIKYLLNRAPELQSLRWVVDPEHVAIEESHGWTLNGIDWSHCCCFSWALKLELCPGSDEIVHNDHRCGTDASGGKTCIATAAVPETKATGP